MPDVHFLQMLWTFSKVIFDGTKQYMQTGQYGYQELDSERGMTPIGIPGSLLITSVSQINCRLTLQ